MERPVALNQREGSHGTAASLYSEIPQGNALLVLTRGVASPVFMWIHNCVSGIRGHAPRKIVKTMVQSGAFWVF